MGQRCVNNLPRDQPTVNGSMRKRLDLTGQRFGKLKAVDDVGSKSSRRIWLCQCDCGEITFVIGQHLKSGKTQSCGCLKVEQGRKNGLARKRHGMYKTATWNSWQAMLSRCQKKSDKEFHNYGGRGVKVCDRWHPKKGGSFENFLADMGKRPEGKTLDKDKLGDGMLYSPKTCCWLTPKEQAQHRRKSLSN